MDEGVITCLITFYRDIAYCTLNFVPLSFMHDHNLLKQIRWANCICSIVSIEDSSTMGISSTYILFTTAWHGNFPFYDLWMTCALCKCMKHASLLVCLWDTQVKIKSPAGIVRTTALPSNWAKTGWIAGNTENNTEYTNWQQVPCCHTYFFFCVFSSCVSFQFQ